MKCRFRTFVRRRCKPRRAVEESPGCDECCNNFAAENSVVFVEFASAPGLTGMCYPCVLENLQDHACSFRKNNRRVGHENKPCRSPVTLGVVHDGHLLDAAAFRRPLHAVFSTRYAKKTSGKHDESRERGAGTDWYVGWIYRQCVYLNVTSFGRVCTREMYFWAILCTQTSLLRRKKTAREGMHTASCDRGSGWQ